jgi:hypothetical protein
MSQNPGALSWTPKFCWQVDVHSPRIPQIYPNKVIPISSPCYPMLGCRMHIWCISSSSIIFPRWGQAAGADSAWANAKSTSWCWAFRRGDERTNGRASVSPTKFGGLYWWFQHMKIIRAPGLTGFKKVFRQNGSVQKCPSKMEIEQIETGSLLWETSLLTV